MTNLTYLDDYATFEDCLAARNNTVTIDTSSSGDLRRGAKIAFIFANEKAAKSAVKELPTLLEINWMYPSHVLSPKHGKTDAAITKILATKTVEYSKNEQPRLLEKKLRASFDV